jgi:hypothetical protein
MKLTARDRRALLLLAAAVPVVVVLRLVTGSGGETAVSAAADAIPVAERRLERVRRLAASVPGKEEVLKQVRGELAVREKGVIVADTAAQAQARLLEVVRRVGKAQTPPLDFGSVEFPRPVSGLAGDYGEVFVTVPFACHIEDLLNLLAELTRQTEAVATTELRISAADAKQKTINVRLTLAGVVPGRLVPARKELF